MALKSDAFSAPRAQTRRPFDFEYSLDMIASRSDNPEFVGRECDQEIAGAVFGRVMAARIAKPTNPRGPGGIEVAAHGAGRNVIIFPPASPLPPPSPPFFLLCFAILPKPQPRAPCPKSRRRPARNSEGSAPEKNAAAESMPESMPEMMPELMPESMPELILRGPGRMR